MMRLKALAACLALATLALPGGAGLADPWKDESGHGRREYRDDRRERWDHRGRDDRRERWDHRGRDDRRDEWEHRRQEGRGDDRRGAYRGERWDERAAPWPPYHAQPRIPPGHLPPPGEGRLWFPDRPPGHQPPPFRY
jgi:hypothetical protein